MATLLIDGYNVLALCNYNDRERFIIELSDYAKRKPHDIIVVFDGTFKGSSFGTDEHYAGIRLVYSPRGVSADDVIEKMLENELLGKTIVISSDRRIQRAATNAGASFVKSQEFLPKLRSPNKTNMTTQNDAAWMEGRQNEDRLYKQKPKKGPKKRLSKKDKRKKRGMDDL